MIFTIENLLTPEKLDIIAERLKTDDFIDGKTTAGWHARIVKENTQLSSKATYAQEIKDSIKVALEQNPLFKVAAQPKVVHSMLISRLDTIRRSIFQQQGKTIEFDLISKSHANLLRQWSQL